MTDLEMLMYLLNKLDTPATITNNQELEYYDLDGNESWKEVIPTVINVNGLFKFDINGNLIK